MVFHRCIGVVLIVLHLLLLVNGILLTHKRFPLSSSKNNLRSRQHIKRILKYDEAAPPLHVGIVDALSSIYEEKIEPLEESFHYDDLDDGNDMSVQEIQSGPMVLLLGPWSSGKTTLINYLLDTSLLRVGAEPTTSEFTVISYGNKLKKTDGRVLVADKSKEYAPLQKFGKNFLERLTNVEIPHPLLKKITFIDTPGVVENRKQLERGYPYNKVMKWFIERAELILMVFDPNKLDIGREFETLFKQLRGKESQIRLLLNKADAVDSRDLMKVYGTLYWSLGPLLNVTEPPRIYMGSYWSYEYKPSPNTSMFKNEENCLLKDFKNLIDNDVENRIAAVRQHAIKVRIHANLVNEYLNQFYTEWSLFTSEYVAAANVIAFPERYDIFRNVYRRLNINPRDLSGREVYKQFFAVHELSSMTSLAQQCTFFYGCPIAKLNDAISDALPALLTTLLNLKSRQHGEL